MQAAERNYSRTDRSRQKLLFEDPHFPAYFRLVKYKLLDFCIKSVDRNGGGYFNEFEELFNPGELDVIVKTITSPIPDPMFHDPLMQKIKQADLDDKPRRQAESYAALLHQHNHKVQKRRCVEYFLNKVLYCERGLRIADEIIFYCNEQIYGMSHWNELPDHWEAPKTFLEKFFDPEELEANPFARQKLDTVAGAARGSLIMKHLKSNPLCSDEYGVLVKEIQDSNYQLETDLMRNLLDEGPEFELKMVDGQENRIRAEKWNVHSTRILFFSIPGFPPHGPQSDREEWYFGLLDAMKNDPYNRAALYMWKKDYAEVLEQREKERDILRLQALKGQRADEEAVGEIITQIRPQKKNVGYNPDADRTELELRNYQEELVQPALDGKNCVIVAPTGSGKTEVAVYAAMKHIEERTNQGKAARVVFLVTKIPLVSQQKDRFLKYCKGMYNVTGLHGSEKSDSGEGRCEDVLDSHITVMTPQILINMFQSVRKNERLYVSDFSLMIFDEVHATTGNHPYVILNQIVQEWEHDKPQIMGLTASLNVSASVQTDESQMMNSIYEMLALLNAPHLGTITRQANIDELNEIVSKPDDSVEICQPGTSDLRSYIERWLTKHHLRFCSELDRLRARNSTFSSGFFAKFKKSNPKLYESYVTDLQTIVQDLNRLNSQEKNLSQLYAKYMKIYTEARGMSDVMPPLVAIRYMETELDKLRNRGADQFGDFFNGDCENLKKICEDSASEPSIVRKLKETLVSQFKTTPTSRVIIFVTQRSTAQRVCDFLNESSELQVLRKNARENPVGFVLGTNKGGLVQQSPQEQQAVLDSFNNGHLKIIVATSVVEEGLDVAACNLIIKYNCASQSVIQLIQQRGRARAKNSRTVLLAVKSSLNEKRNNALISEKYMRMCMKKIEKDGPRQLAIEVDRLKREIALNRKRALEERQLRFRNDNKVYRMTCANCHLLFCKSNVIKKVYSNYMAFDPKIWNQLGVEPKRKTNRYLDADTQPLSKIKCIKCQTEIGKAYKMRGVYLPQLDVKYVAFIEENSDSDSMETRAKWSAVDEMFFIPDALDPDFAMMLNALTDTEANIEKKRILDLDSKQHIRDIEMRRFRDLEEKAPVVQDVDFSDNEG